VGVTWFLSLNLPVAAHVELMEFLTMKGIYFVAPRPDEQRLPSGGPLPEGWEARVYIAASSNNKRILADKFSDQLAARSMAGEFGPVR
jgi:hypothetical protein